MGRTKCRRCGLVNFAGAVECRRCNAPLSVAADTGAGQGGFDQQAAFSQASGGYNPQPNYNPGYSTPNYGTAGGAYVSPYGQPEKLKSGQATASLVLGVLGVFTAGLIGIGSLIGLALGIRATVKASNQPFVYGGKGVAIGGIVTNSLGLLTIFPWAMILAIAIPNLMMARIAANEASAIGVMRNIGVAEATYQSTKGEGRHFAGLEELIEEGLLPRDVASKHGYHFRIRVVDTRSAENGRAAASFEAVAVPDSYGTSGRRSFYTSETYVIHSADRQGREATADDKPFDEYDEEFQYPSDSRRRRGTRNW